MALRFERGQQYMKIQEICMAYFSPTGGTKKAVAMLTDTLAQELGAKVRQLDITKKENREDRYGFREDELLVLGVPVYAGRIPNKLLPELKKLLAESPGTPVLPVSVYGNRNYDEALRELILLCEEKGMLAVAAVAAISQHAFSSLLATGRPDEEDGRKLSIFARKIAEKLRQEENPTLVQVDRETPIGPYYTPKKADGNPASFLKAKPLTDPEKCVDCGICAEVCPLDSIDKENVSSVPGVCIKCHACVRKCPYGAKYFDNEDFLSHVDMLEKHFTARREPELFL